MDAFQMIAERRIAEAMERGAFEHLQGAGKRLPKDTDPEVPVELHMAYKILKNAGCLPPEMEVRKQINNLAELLAVCEEGDQRQEHLRQLRALLERLGTIRHLPAELEAKYFNDILERLRPHAEHNG